LSQIGWVDVANSFQIAGWACDTNSQQPALVDILVDNRKIAALTACAFRGDLQEYRNGYAAFHFSPHNYLDGASRVIEVRFSNGGLLLNNGRKELHTVSSAPSASTFSETAQTSKENNPWNNDKPYSYQNSWLGAKRYTDHINRQITGETGRHWFDYAIAKYLLNSDTGGKRCLILGSNEGHMEVELCQKGFLGQIVATDIAEKALRRAAARVECLGYKGVQHVCADLNHYDFNEKFDFIIAEGVLHHIEKLELCVDRLCSCLNEGGLLIGMEFVGAHRFQLSERQLRWINAALSTVPRKLRPLLAEGDAMMPPSLLEQSIVHYTKPSIEEMIAFDPSEAASGFKLPHVVRSRFSMLEEVPTGGSLLMYMAGHFPLGEANTDEFVDEWLGVLMHIEAVLNKTGILPYENLFFVAQKSTSDQIC
jgi:SAM-dependent methyltransferase